MTVLKRRKLIFVLGFLVAVLLGAGYMAVAERAYVSSAKVLVQGAASDPVLAGGRTTDTINLDTEAQIVTSFAVAELAQKRLGTSVTPLSLTRRVTVTVPPNTTVLQIAYRAPTGEQAQFGAQAFARSYVDHRLQEQQGLLDAQTSRVDAELTLASNQLTKVNKKLGQAKVSVDEQAALRSQRSVLTARVEALNTRLAALGSVIVAGGQVINDAQQPAAPTTPDPWLVIPAALFLGILLGLALALWRDSRDPRLHSESDLVRVFDLIPLANLEAPSAQLRGSTWIRDYDVRALYYSLRAMGPPSHELVVVFAPDVSEVAEAVSRALVEAASRSGARAEHEVLAAGDLDSARLQEVLSRVKEKSEFAIVALHSNESAVDLPLVLRHVDVALMVVQLGSTTRRSIAESLKALEAMGATSVQVATVPRSRRRWSGRSQRSAASVDQPDTRGEPRGSRQGDGPLRSSARP